MKEKVVAVVPVYNSKDDVRRVRDVLSAAKARGLVDEVLFMDDGSVDGSAQVVRELGEKVVRHTEHMGSSMSFISAAGYCKADKADILLIVPPWLTNLDTEKLEVFLDNIVGKKGVDMVSGEHLWEGKNIGETYKCQPRFSSFRALRMSAIEPLFHLDRLWWLSLNENRALDPALENLIERKKAAPDMDLKAKAQWRDSEATGEISAGIIWAENVRKDDAIRKLFIERMDWLIAEQPDHPLVESFRRKHRRGIVDEVRKDAARLDPESIKEHVRIADAQKIASARK